MQVTVHVPSTGLSRIQHLNMVIVHLKADYILIKILLRLNNDSKSRLIKVFGSIIMHIYEQMKKVKLYALHTESLKCQLVQLPR